MPPAAAPSTKRLQPTVIRLPLELHREAKERAEAEDLTLAQMVRRALREYLARGERGR